MKVYVVYGVLEERDTGMIVDHYPHLYDVFSNEEEAYKMVKWLETKGIYGYFEMEEFTVEDKFNPDNYNEFNLK